MSGKVVISYTASFIKSYQKLPKKIQNLASKKAKVFEINPFHPSLKTHKLTGKLKTYWSFSVNLSYRIVFTFQSKNKVIFMDIGTHSIYN